MLGTELIETWLDAFPKKTIGVLGDLFLDRYLEIDASLTEPSLETGLDAYQVTQVRSRPGALGTIINNLVALGIGAVWPIAIIGDDGEGYELRQALRAFHVVRLEGVFSWEDRRTPTYTKPMLGGPGIPLPRELNRFDIKNRTRTPNGAEQRVIELLEEAWPRLDALIVLDQISEEECGVVTHAVREHVRRLARKEPAKFVLADSRERIALFESVAIKPNALELQRAAFPGVTEIDTAWRLAQRNQHPVFLTRSEAGMEIYDARFAEPHAVPGYPVAGPIDIVGAGDSCSAAISCAIASGATLHEAAAFGNLVASITVQQIGTTGTASPAQVRQRWAEVSQTANQVT